MPLAPRASRISSSRCWISSRIGSATRASPDANGPCGTPGGFSARCRCTAARAAFGRRFESLELNRAQFVNTGPLDRVGPIARRQALLKHAASSNPLFGRSATLWPAPPARNRAGLAIRRAASRLRVRRMRRYPLFLPVRGICLAFGFLGFVYLIGRENSIVAIGLRKPTCWFGGTAFGGVELAAGEVAVCDGERH